MKIEYDNLSTNFFYNIKMKILYSSFVCAILNICAVHAQNAPADIIKNTLNKMRSLKTISYEVKNIDKSFFTNDTINSEEKTTMIFNDTGRLQAVNQINSSKNLRYKTIYLGDTSYMYNFLDSAYTKFKTPVQNYSNRFLEVLSGLKSILEQKSAKIIQKEDTVIQRADCYNFFIIANDTIENGVRNYGYIYLAVDKQNLLPIFYKVIAEGRGVKDGHSIGYVSMYFERNFYNYSVNKTIDDSMFYVDRNLYKLPNKILANGTGAPPLALRDLSGKQIDSSIFKDKILLMEFGSILCPANPLTTPLLNRLYQKYKSQSVAVFSIYSSETAEQAKKYIVNQHIQFPVYLGSAKLSKDYHAPGAPYFYIIDKTGKIAKGIVGYYDELEKDLTTKIDFLLNKK
ncbi:MAG: TlpA family protein disulfide reductase [Chitinophagaceae bacterium]|nr:TlpA family protein disulfide reductase [Chitinophagaceae bacterium]